MSEAVTRIDTPVLIVGAGPVGMTLALDLAWRGVDVVIAERHAEDELPVVRCNHIAARTMETFRRLGIAKEVRQAGLPGDHPHDVAFVTSLRGYELCRIKIPARDKRWDDGDYADAGWPTTEPPHRCNQMYFEPILQRHMIQSRRVRAFYNVEIETLNQDEGGVSATGRHLGTGETFEFRSDFLVGADGGSSRVRKAIGAKFEGDEVISRTRSLTIRSTELGSKSKVAPAWTTCIFNPRVFGNLVALNGKDMWAFHLWLPNGATDFDVIDPDEAIKAALGTDLEYEVVATENWYGRRLVADKFLDRRAVICGDAAHIWVPMAGYGMNAGIADAMDLSWQLAAAIKGWAPASILAAYDAERRPVTEQVSKHVRAVAVENLHTELVKHPPAEIEAPGVEGDAVRAKFGRFFYDANVGQFACLGLNFGTFYDVSPIISYDGEQPPTYHLLQYTPSTVPGCRTPHIWLSDGTSLYDRLGPDYTLLRFNPSVAVAPLVEAAEQRGVPLAVLDLDPCDAGEIYKHKLLLSRPDQHVAWRGDVLPTDALALVDLVRGASTAIAGRLAA